jgi:hypothetical protein
MTAPAIYREWHPGMIPLDVGKTAYCTALDGLAATFASVALMGYVFALRDAISGEGV